MKDSIRAIKTNAMINIKALFLEMCSVLLDRNFVVLNSKSVLNIQNNPINEKETYVKTAGSALLPKTIPPKIISETPPKFAPIM